MDEGCQKIRMDHNVGLAQATRHKNGSGLSKWQNFKIKGKLKFLME